MSVIAGFMAKHKDKLIALGVIVVIVIVVVTVFLYWRSRKKQDTEG